MTNQIIHLGPIHQLIDDWLQDCEADGLTADTIENYGQYVRDVFLGWSLGHGISPLNAKPKHLKHFRGYLMTKYAETSTNSIVSAVRVFYKWLMDQTDESGKPYIPMNPAASLKSLPTSGEPLRDPFSDREVEMLLQTTEGTSPVQIRDRFLLELSIRCGLRQIELFRARLQDIYQVETSSGPLYVMRVMGKGMMSRNQKVAFMPPVEKAYLDYLAIHPHRKEAKGPLFVVLGSHCRREDLKLGRGAIYYAIRKRLNQIGIKGRRRSPHSTRATMATRAYRNNIPPKDLLTLGRWATWTTASQYAHKVDRFEEPPEAYVTFDFDEYSSSGD